MIAFRLEVETREGIQFPVTNRKEAMLYKAEFENYEEFVHVALNRLPHRCTVTLSYLDDRYNVHDLGRFVLGDQIRHYVFQETMGKFEEVEILGWTMQFRGKIKNKIKVEIAKAYFEKN